MHPLAVHIELFAPDHLGRVAPLTPHGARQEDYALWESQINRIFRLIEELNGTENIQFILAGRQENEELRQNPPEYTDTLGILFLRTYHLSRPSDFFWHLPDSGLRPISKGQNQEIGLPYFPILSIGTEDIAPLFAEEQQAELDYHPYLGQEIDARVKFLDSNIWHRYVSLKQCPLDEEGFEGRLKPALMDIISYFRAGLYDTVAAKASLEFQLRMLRESFIARLGEGGHNKVVTPFKFHSETRMKIKAEKEKAFFEQKWNDYPLKGKVKWRLLMVDDYAADPISAPEPQQGNGSGRKDIISKMDWIYAQIPDFGEYILIDYPKPAESNSTLPADAEQKKRRSADKGIIQKSLKKMEETTYDIILLDYLLGLKNEQPSQNSDQREYGYEFLMKLLEDSQTGKFAFNRGPLGLFWVFPISSFPFALSDKLRQLGINNYSGLWHLAGGGDPISTPYLFQYNLIRFLKQQVLEAYMDDKSLARQLSTYSYIKDRITWSEVVEAHLGNLLARIKILKSYQPDDYKKYDGASDFSRSLYFHILTTDYQDILDKFLKLVQLVKAPKDPDGLLASFIDGKDPFGSPGGEQTEVYIRSAKVLREKIREYFISSKELSQRIEKTINDPEFSISGSGGRIILSLPRSIGKSDKIINLKLTDHWLQSLPEALAELPLLKSLNLRSNKLRNFPDVLFALKDQLVYLDLRDNPLPNGLDIEARSKKEVLELFERAELFRPGNILEKLKKIKSNNDLKKRIKELILLIKTSDIDLKDWIDEMASLLFRFHQNESDFRDGVVKTDDYQTERTRIFLSSRDIISEIEQYLGQQEQ